MGLQKETHLGESMEWVAILDFGKILKTELNLPAKCCLSRRYSYKLNQAVSIYYVIFCHFRGDLHC